MMKDDGGSFLEEDKKRKME